MDSEFKTIINDVESVIGFSKIVPKIGTPKRWHNQAHENSRGLSAQELVTAGSGLLDEMPYEEIAQSIENARQNNPDAMNRMRQSRKLFMIARDAILFGTENQSLQEIDDLFIVCRSLGKVADSNATHEPVVHKALTSIERLAINHAVDIDYAGIASSALLSHRVMMALHTPVLASRKASSHLDHSEYHGFRKDFRRVVNAYTIHASQTYAMQDIHFAARGILINNYYGNVNDTIDK